MSTTMPYQKNNFPFELGAYVHFLYQDWFEGLMDLKINKKYETSINLLMVHCITTIENCFDSILPSVEQQMQSN